MVLNKYIPANMNLRVFFGTYKVRLNRDTGVSEPVFTETVGPLMAMGKHRTNYLVTHMPDARIIVVWHNPKLDDTLTCRIDDKYYSILQIEPDDTPNPNGFDDVYLKQETTVEGDDNAG